jgi:hypothetical protein
MWLSSSVTAPSRASRRPSTSAPVVPVIDVMAKMVPLKVEDVPSVAELPTTQNTLPTWAPLMSTTSLAPAVVSVVPAWKMNTAFSSPWASSVSVPVIPKEVSRES